MRISASERSLGEVRDQAGNAASAALTASSTWDTEAAGTLAISAPVAASSTASAAPSPFTSRPPINSFVFMPLSCGESRALDRARAPSVGRVLAGRGLQLYYYGHN